MVIYATRESDPPHRVFSELEIVESICRVFPSGHRERITQIVPGRIEKLSRQKVIHFNAQAKGYVLSHSQRQKLEAGIGRAADRELAFRAALHSAIIATVEDREIDYDYDIEGLLNIAHECVFWYMHEQGKRFVDPYNGLTSILNADRLVALYLEANPPASGCTKLTERIINDILPHAIYSTLNSKSDDTRQYLRAKADLFVVQAFMQVTPDVQAACQKILGNDT